MKQLKLVRVWVMIILVIAFFSAVIPSSVFAGGPTNGWSQSMWTTLLTPGQYDCVRYWWGGTEHCRKVITGLKFHPDALRCPTKNKISGKCYYIVFNGQTQKLAMGFEKKRNGYSDFYWGVPTRWPSWQGKWEFKLMNGTTW
jgi:hypothetical protein